MDLQNWQFMGQIVAQITSLSNPKIKQARTLQKRKGRQKSQLFLVEGIHHLGAAAESGAQIEYVLYAPDHLTSTYANELIASWRAQSVPCYAASLEVLASLTTKEGSQGILAVVRQQLVDLESLTRKNFPWGVALVNPQDPGNVGAILRTINAAGASGLVLLDGGVDVYHPTAVRASMGALFWHPVVTATSDHFLAWAKREGFTLYGSSAHGDMDYRTAHHFAQPAILLLGNERTGLPEEIKARCETTFRLPMAGRVTSLNLAVAAGILLYRMQKSNAG
jgi:TrmH family RNA methyltransferase